MRTLTSVFISGLLLMGAVACDNAARTTSQAPESTDTTTQPPDPEKAQEIQKESTSEVRRNQLDADIRAREERNQMAGGTAERTDADLRSEVRSKLEANLPASQLTVEANDGNVSISGTVPTQPQYQRIEPLAKEIYGVKSVDLKNVTVAPAQPKN